jgi:putative acetyltransferase
MHPDCAPRFRQAVSADIPAMSDIRLSVTENVLSDPARVTMKMYEDYLLVLGRGWVAEIDGVIVAFCYAARADGSIWALFVRPGHEGQGLAKVLLSLAVDWIFELGHDRARLDTGAHTRADRFYAMQGWERRLAGETRVDYFLYKKQSPDAKITFETPDQPDVQALIDELDAYLYSLYPAENVYALDLSSLLGPGVLFAVARDAAGVAQGCGAMVVKASYGEVKRMYVRPAARGQGLARRLIEALEGKAMAQGCRSFMLETGPAQPEALMLYQRLGYAFRGPFGDYPEDPLSVFMQKNAL